MSNKDQIQIIIDAVDLSKNKNDGVLYNSPTWSGSYAPGI